MTGSVGEALEFRILGRVEVWGRGEPLEIGGPRQRAVLALLLLEGNRVVSPDRFLDQLWGEAPPDAARATLQAYVSKL